MNLNQLSGKILEVSIKVHRALGPGMLESAYEACLFYELHKAKLKVEKQMFLPILYDGIKIDAGYRIDLLIEN
jgi:GxxExxY protein